MNQICFSHLGRESLQGRLEGVDPIGCVVRGRTWYDRGSLVRRRNDGRMLRRSAICLRCHGHVLWHGRRRRSAVGCGRWRIGHGHVAGGRHAAVLVVWRHWIVWLSSVGAHVRIWVHWLLVAHLLVHVRGMLVVVICVVMRLGPTSSPPRSPPSPSSVITPALLVTRPGDDLGSAMHALPSRQMPTVVHHAGLGAVEVRWLITVCDATAIQDSDWRQLGALEVL